MSKKINEATSTDLPVINRLVNEYGWKIGDTSCISRPTRFPIT